MKNTPKPKDEKEVSTSFCKEIEKKYSIPKKRPIYVIHEHLTKGHPHFDLRLEFEGALRSWAIPKRIDLKNLERKSLAVQTSDHPLEYGSFQGKIPEGNYGAGKVLIWDTGTYEIIDHKEDKKLVFRIKGKKLKGDFVLVHFRPKERNWLFFKKKG